MFTTEYMGLLPLTLNLDKILYFNHFASQNFQMTQIWYTIKDKVLYFKSSKERVSQVLTFRTPLYFMLRPEKCPIFFFLIQNPMLTVVIYKQ